MIIFSSSTNPTNDKVAATWSIISVRKAWILHILKWRIWKLQLLGHNGYLQCNYPSLSLHIEKPSECSKCRNQRHNCPSYDLPIKIQVWMVAINIFLLTIDLANAFRRGQADALISIAGSRARIIWKPHNIEKAENFSPSLLSCGTIGHQNKDK